MLNNVFWPRWFTMKPLFSYYLLGKSLGIVIASQLEKYSKYNVAIWADQSPAPGLARSLASPFDHVSLRDLKEAFTAGAHIAHAVDHGLTL